MALLVLAYPELSESDFNWVQNHRKLNDKLYFNIVKPHFTIVFPIFELSEDDFTNEVLNKIDNIEPFEFTIRSAVVNKDSFIDTYHEFLVPDEGFSSFIKLHDYLYKDLYSNNLRLDIDFIPHIGIGNSNNSGKCKNNVDQINSSYIEINGKVNSLDIVEYEDNKIDSLRKLHL